MNPWSNIQVSPEDPEIIRIDDLEKQLGPLTDDVRKIRELITRFEVCHCNYLKHLKKIKKSIRNLKPSTDPEKIGTNHFRYGENAIRSDTTGRSATGQQYFLAIRDWIENDQGTEYPGDQEVHTGLQVKKWLGEKKPDKMRLVRLLIARMTWDWEAFKKLPQGGEFRDLELQASSIDICHYDFPHNLELVLQAIGQMKPASEFEGCGSYNMEIKDFLEKEFFILNDLLTILLHSVDPDKNALMRAWLVASLAKTIKADTNLKIPLNI